MNKEKSTKRIEEVEVYSSEYNQEWIDEEAAYLMAEGEATKETAFEWALMSFQDVQQEQFDFITTAIQEAELLFLEGSGGRWDGRYEIASTVTPKELFKVLGNYDDIIIREDSRGRVHLTGIHHDATDYFEIRKVNRKGIERYEETGLRVGADRNVGSSSEKTRSRLTKNFRLRKALGWI